MAWVRLDDVAISHPKIIGLSDKAFRLWIWGLTYCQTYLTDGLIPPAALPIGMSRVATALVLANLWHAREEGGWCVHDYLDWNDSRAEVDRKRIDAKARMVAVRGKRSQDVRANDSVRTSDEVPVGLGSGSLKLERESERKPFAYSQIDERPGRLREQLYPQWYALYRHGARLSLVASPLEYQEAVRLCNTWDDNRLEKLAKIVLTTDDPFIAGTDRSFRIFALKATWADDRLASWEKTHGVAQ